MKKEKIKLAEQLGMFYDEKDETFTGTDKQWTALTALTKDVDRLTPEEELLRESMEEDNK